MTYNKFNPTKDETITTWLVRLLWPNVWGPAALAGGIATKQGWPILTGVVVFTIWFYLRSAPLRNRIKDNRRYDGSDVDLKWHRKAVSKAPERYAAAGLSISNPRNLDGPPLTPDLANCGPCPLGDRWVVNLIPGVQHGGDFLERLHNLESAFGRRLIVELSNNPRQVILIWLFSDPLSQIRRPNDNRLGE